ncbi:MAG: hypothetical protein J2P19_06965 [Pseudonocardia sp.]|nr:hypothetical protein [Pseudonocardia sp.]
MSTYVIEVTEEELTLITAALRSFLSDFGHDQARLQHTLKELIAKLPRIEQPA